MEKKVSDFYKQGVNGLNNPMINKLSFGISAPDYPIVNAIILILFAIAWKVTYDAWFILPVIFMAFSFYSLRVWIIKNEILKDCLTWENRVQSESSASFIDWNDEDRDSVIKEVTSDQISSKKLTSSNKLIAMFLCIYIVLGFLISML